MKILIIEDEYRAANHLVRILGKVAPAAEVMARLESVEDSVAWLGEQGDQIDLILSDIQLADGLSFEIFAACTISCPIIFTTAFDNYAIKAFETNGIDYLLKPVSEDRLRKALDKVEKLQPAIPLEAIMALAKSNPNQPAYKSRFMVKVGMEIKSIPVEEIKAFFSFEKATYALTEDGRKHLLDQPLDQLEPRVNPATFFRISRKYLIAHSAISKIFAHSNSRLKLLITGLDDHDIIVARERVSGFKEWLDQ